MFAFNDPHKFAALGAMLSMLVLGGCKSDNTSPNNDAPVTLKVQVGIGEVNTLAKSSTISLKKLIFVMTSNTGDTLRDTITTTSSPVSISATSTSPQTIVKDYVLKPLRTWKIIATTRGALDSIIHQDTATSGVLNVGDTVNVTLNMDSKYSMYDAKFLTIPDSISSSVVGTAKQVLILNRLVFKIDGTAKVDSTKAGGFASLATATLYYDYVTVGSHSISLEAWGRIKASSPDSLLYTGTQTINSTAGSDSTVAFNLTWVGPTTGTGHLSTTIGKVGKITVHAGLPGSTVP